MVALLAVAALLSLAWTTATAPLNGPDESAHVAYAQNVAENGSEPSNVSGSGTESTELGSADFFFGLHPSVSTPASKPNWSAADLAAYAKTEKTFNAATRKDGSGPNAEGKTPPLYYVWEAAWYKVGSGLHIMDRLYLMRLANIPLLLLTVLFTWLLSGLLFRQMWVRTTATALAALQPMTAFMSGVVNPDTLLATEWAAFAYVGTSVVLRGPSRWRLIAILLLVVASFLTQGRGIPLVVPAVLAVLLSLWRHRERYPRAVWMAPAALVVIAIAGAVWLSQRSAYGGELTLGVNFKLGNFLSYVWQFYLPPIGAMTPPPGPAYGFHQMMIEEFLGGRFGSLEIGFRPIVYALLEFVFVMVAAGLVTAVVARWAEVKRIWDVALLLVAIVVSEILLLHLVSFRSIAAGTGDPLIVGRYLVPLVPIYAVCGAFVVGSAGRRFGPYLAALMIGGSIALQFGGLALTVGRFYG